MRVEHWNNGVWNPTDLYGRAHELDLLPTPRASRGASTTETAYALGGERDDTGRTQGEVLLPPPTASRYGSNQSASAGAAVRSSLDSITDLLPTPSAADGGGGHLIEFYLPTPNASDGTGGGQHPDKRVGHSQQLIDYVLAPERWGKYAPAIARWEQITRPAPSPTQPNSLGNPRLAAGFSEWMMGWPDGWVTDVPGVSRNDQLRIIGNGVVPQCASAALRWLLSVDCGVAA